MTDLTKKQKTKAHYTRTQLPPEKNAKQGLPRNIAANVRRATGSPGGHLTNLEVRELLVKRFCG